MKWWSPDVTTQPWHNQRVVNHLGEKTRATTLTRNCKYNIHDSWSRSAAINKHMILISSLPYHSSSTTRRPKQYDDVNFMKDANITSPQTHTTTRTLTKRATRKYEMPCLKSVRHNTALRASGVLPRAIAVRVRITKSRKHARRSSPMIQQWEILCMVQWGSRRKGSDQRTIQIEYNHFALSVSVHGTAFRERRIPMRSDVVATHCMREEMWATSIAKMLGRTEEKARTVYCKDQVGKNHEYQQKANQSTLFP